MTTIEEIEKKYGRQSNNCGHRDRLIRYLNSMNETKKNSDPKINNSKRGLK